MKKEKLIWSEDEITTDMLDTPLQAKMIIFLSIGVSLWPDAGDQIYREADGRLRVRKNEIYGRI